MESEKNYKAYVACSTQREAAESSESVSLDSEDYSQKQIL